MCYFFKTQNLQNCLNRLPEGISTISHAQNWCLSVFISTNCVFFEQKPHGSSKHSSSLASPSALQLELLLPRLCPQQDGLGGPQASQLASARKKLKLAALTSSPRVSGLRLTHESRGFANHGGHNGRMLQRPGPRVCV